MTSVLIAASAKLPVINPLEMQYGGIERAAYEYCVRLHEMGFEVLPAFPADSELPFDFDHSALWPTPSLCGPARKDALSLEEIAAGQSPFAHHVVETAKRMRPDVILLMGPRFELLTTFDQTVPELWGRTIVALHNGPAYYGQEMLEFLTSTGALNLVALTEKHRASFGPLAERMTVIREGVPVDRLTVSLDPAEARRSTSVGLVRHPDRRLLSQIDMIGPQKGQLLAVMMFAAAGLHSQGFDFLIGGDFGATGPSIGGTGPLEHRQSYLDAVTKFIVENDLQEFVYPVGALNGAQVAEIYRCSDFVVSPHRMDHGKYWPFESQTAEAYGQAMGIAMASGTPVVCSDQIDSSRMRIGLTGYDFSDLASGTVALGRMADDCLQSRVDRRAIREFSESHDSVAHTVAGYGRLIEQIAARS